MNATDIVRACFDGLGFAPETGALIIQKGLSNAGLKPDAIFDLPDIQEPSWGLEHDCSISRQDRAEGDFVHLNRRDWKVFLREAGKCQQGGTIDQACYHSARVARDADQKRRNPENTCDSKAATVGGSLEDARVLSVVGDGKSVKLAHVRCFFEHERLPSQCGRKPRPAVGLENFLDLAFKFQKKRNPRLQFKVGSPLRSGGRRFRR
ncbi:hypothetical protein CDD83_7959 [Cordyceps sp. RAO-2017]|nr:hypothetical protein CDD83_7959 [Cordyceps sp. RAO-2017]